MNAAILVAVMALTTIALRFLPFFLFEKKTPVYISYPGKVLPQAIVGLLVIYCLKDTQLAAYPYGLPELLSAVAVIVLQVWKRNAILSILSAMTCVHKLT